VAAPAAASSGSLQGTALASGAARAWIVGPRYDAFFFLVSPVLALLLGMAISGTPFADEEFALWNGLEVTGSSFLIGIFIHAHLVAVFFRSHANPSIFRLHPQRFVAVPLLLFAAMLASPWVLVSVSVLATFWDVYHSALQTFGFARIYDRKAGNDAAEGRRLDWWLNQLLYAGPILAGVTMMDHFEDFYEYEDLGSPATAFFTAIPSWMEGHHGWFTAAVVVGGTLFVAWYVLANWRLQRRGHRIPPQKVWLLASTGLVSIYTWGFNSWGEAFFIMNFFHALQYFGIVWASEQRSLAQAFGVAGSALAKPLTLALFVALPFVYGFAAETVDADVTWFWALTLVVSIMHFWYDGFIWSVRKAQV
jgi:hypothetical protein